MASVVAIIERNMDSRKRTARKTKIQRDRKYGENQKRENAWAQRGRKVAKHHVFAMICGSGGSTSRVVKAVGVEPAAVKTHHCRTLLEIQMSKQCAPLWCEAHLEVKSCKA